MSSIPKLLSLAFALLIFATPQILLAQDKLAWMNDFTDEILIGNDTYRYDFTNVEGNDCKIRIEEQVTNKKGALETRSWIFFLADLDPSKLTFKAKGKSLVIFMETNQSQKFITYFERGEIDSYTNKIRISMNEVGIVRTFLETMKKKIGNCENTQTMWENRDEAFTWLEANVGKASDDEIEWNQKFQHGNRDYLVAFEANSVNGKGEEEKSKYVFDLTDIDPMKINLRIAGKSLVLEIPVKEGNRYISAETPAGTKFTDELLLYSDDIESARQTFNALKYVVTNTSYERLQWDSYKASLDFVKDHLGEVHIGENLISNSLNFDISPTGPVNLTISTTESDGALEAKQYTFYLTDFSDKIKIEVSKSITLKMVTEEKHELIRVTKDEKTIDYSAGLSINVANIDLARDIVNAFEFALLNSQEKIEEYGSINETSLWFSEHVGAVEIDGITYQQKLSVDPEKENQITIEKEVVKSDGTTTESKFILYPEDISLEKLDIKVSGKKLYVPLVTEASKFIKNFEDSEIQNFTSSVEILFSDPLEAKNFMAAIGFLQNSSTTEEQTNMSKEEAMAFLLENIQTIEIPAENYEQQLEIKDEGNCKISFTRMELDDKKPGVEFLYEFSASDISPKTSKLSVKGKTVSLILFTRGNEKLIKPHKNGEAGDFTDEFIIYTADILIAKKALAAFAALSEACK